MKKLRAERSKLKGKEKSLSSLALNFELVSCASLGVR
jgi:hypothetical protein